MVKNLTISRIDNNKFLESLPFFNKATLSSILDKNGDALDYWAKRLVGTAEITKLKNGLYVSRAFLLRIRDIPGSTEGYLEYLASVLCQPSYLSLEHMLGKYGIITEAPYALTSVATKSTRAFTNELGSFVYRSIKRALFCGYREEIFRDKKYFAATPAKSLFDFIYLRNLDIKNLRHELIKGLRINWDALTKDDLKELEMYASLSKSKKMDKVRKLIEEEKLI